MQTAQELHEDLQDVRQEIQSGVILVDASHSQLRTQYSELRTQNSELRTQNSELRTQNCSFRHTAGLSRWPYHLDYRLYIYRLLF